jgi:hypothetical protein
MQGLVERVTVIFYDKAHVPVQKFVFKLAVNQSYGSKLEEANLEFALRAFLIKLTVAEPVTKPVPPGSPTHPDHLRVIFYSLRPQMLVTFDFLCQLSPFVLLTKILML